jgi:bifunctional non-homologous end joining protein LigD
MSAKEKLAGYRSKRDFTKTAEPKGGARKSRAKPKSDEKALEFVIQKHSASHLHYDLRLEVGGVMKSWAVPKGPSTDTSVRRLAMEVEDHPIEYNAFEGTIPKGEYGGGTVMLWDRGSYTADEKAEGESDEQAMKRGYREGKLSFTFHGDRLRGSYALVRTRGKGGDDRSQWLLIKHRDDFAGEGDEITEEFTTSVATGRSMEEIASGKGGGRVWRSNRADSDPEEPKPAARPPSLPKGLEPMLARSGGPEPKGSEWTFEPKYDGIRVLVFATDGGAALVTRNGNDKSKQFPEVTEALRAFAADLGKPVVLDGEIVALREGKIVRFEALQGRMHISDARRADRLAEQQPAALVVFDLLLSGEEGLTSEPWTERRAALEELLGGRTGERIVLGETSRNRAALRRRAEKEGWEGLIAKRTASTYQPGSRSGDWVKLKIEHQQEFVVGGWTEPRKSREHLGALLLGFYRDGKLVYAGHTGTGFTRDSLRDMMKRLKPLARKTPPFSTRPTTNEPAHWVRPSLVVEIRFNEWTSEGKLRQPVFLGVREDKDPKSVVREEETAPEAKAAPPARKPPKPRARPITNPDKVFFPRTGETKGDLVEYYATMAEYILPWMEDRPLVLKRYPDGIEGEAFYQQAATGKMPAGVRVEKVKIVSEGRPRLMGGNVATLLYTIQHAAISYDPWHSRLGDLASADDSIIDLDPGPGADLETAVEVALRVKEELDGFGLHGALKTSGSRGLHIYLPLPPGTPLEASTLLAQIVATRTARQFPKIATVERMTKQRPRGTVYVDYLQNILGKTVAGVYAVRAKPGATVSTPLRWEELEKGIRMKDFNLHTVPERVREVGDLWAEEMSTPNSLESLIGEGGA